MRLFIIVLSIIIFILSGLITYRALEIPGYDFSYKNNQQQSEPQTLSPAPKDNSDQFIKEQPASDPQIEKLQMEQNARKIQVEKLQAEITELKKKLAEHDTKPVAAVQSQDIDNQEKVIAVLGGGTFLSGQVVVSERFTSSMNDLVKALAASPDHQIVIEGHTDNIPIKPAAEELYKDNRNLSLLRAQAIARILVENGISSDRISVIGYGDVRPIALNDTPEGRAKKINCPLKMCLIRPSFLIREIITMSVSI